jgi:LysM repeat protein
MRRRSPGRWLAPLALVIAAVAVYAVVDSGGRSGGTTTSGGASPHPARRPAHRPPAARKVRPARTYTVRAGDTFSTISAKTGVPLTRIRALNPGVDEQALRIGQKIKLAP